MIMSTFLDEMLGLAQRPQNNEPIPIAMTIGGSDSGAGAGIQADLKTFAAHKVYGTTVITLVTAQNTQKVSLVEPLPEHVVRAQFIAVVDDTPPAASKIGALGSEEMIEVLVELLQDRPLHNLVLDPVMVSKHGDMLMPEKAARTMSKILFERAALVTPNRFEAEVLCGRPVDDPASMKDAAKRLFDFGPKYVLIKGPHLGSVVRDFVYDGTGFVEFGADRVDSRRVHGSGCVFSAAITSRLAHGDAMLDAIAHAREFMTRAIQEAPHLGLGISPVHPLHQLW